MSEQGASSDSMPQGLVEPFDFLWNEVVWVHMAWDMYAKLFAKDQTRIDLLLDTAPAFFGISADTLRSEVHLGISRLTDNAQQGSNKNLTLETLIDEANRRGDARLATELGSDFAYLRKQATGVRKWRHKELAHSDQATALKLRPNLVPNVSIKEVNEILRLISRFMNKVQRHYENATSLYKPPLDGGVGADALCEWLEAGQKFHALHMKVLNGHRVTEKDFE